MLMHWNNEEFKCPFQPKPSTNTLTAITEYYSMAFFTNGNIPNIRLLILNRTFNSEKD